MRQPNEEAILVAPAFLISQHPAFESARRRWEVAVDGVHAKQRLKPIECKGVGSLVETTYIYI